jgi:PAS domain S-box-containing protein
VQLQAEKKQPSLQLEFVPAFAQYILSHKLDEFVRLQYRYTYEEGFQLLSEVQHLSEEEKLEIGFQYNRALLASLARNTSGDFIQHRMAQWAQSDVPFHKYSVNAGDIPKLSYIRKRAFLQLLPEFCIEGEQMLRIIGELDRFFLDYDAASLEVHARMLEAQAAERSLFIEKVNATLPGALYVFELATYHNLYVNVNFAEVMGFSSEELNMLGEAAIASLVHPDDQAEVLRHLENIRKAQDGEILSYQYRIHGKDGVYRWFRNFESPFRRDAIGAITEIIAISLNINAEKKTAERLRQREEQLLEAQAIAHIGSYYWVLNESLSTGTPELKIILEIGPDEHPAFLDRIHPSDRARVEADIAAALESGHFESEYRYIGKEREKHLWARGVVHYREGAPYAISGTVMDITDRKHLLRQAEESEQLYREVEVLANMGNWYWDEQKKELRWTDNLYRLYGLEPQSEPMTRERFLSFVHPEDRAHVVESMEKGYPDDVADHRFRIITAGGETRVLHSLAQVERAPDGRLLRVFGSEKDITKQHYTEEALKKQKHFLSKLTNATPAIIASYNIQTGEYTFVSEAMETILGYSPQQIMDGGLAFASSLVHPDDFGPLMARNQEALDAANDPEREDPGTVEFRYRMRNSNGDWRWIQTFGTIFARDAQGQVEHLLNISLDITAQLEAERRIEEQEYFIQHLADASPMVLYLFDIPSGRFRYLNREIFYVLGYTPEEVLGMDRDAVTNLYHPNDLPLLPERTGSESHFHYQESMVQYECRLRKKDGDWYWLLAREVVFKKDESGAVQQILGAALDINRRKEMERTLLQNSFQLEQSNASLEEFAYVASHDLKEPLRKISTFGDRLVSYQMDRLSDDGKIYLGKIVDASQRMQAMIDDLLSVSRISGNRSFEKVSLQDLLDDAIGALEFKIEQQGAQIVADPLPDAEVVPSQFRQLFQNLLSNSLKFAREGVPPEVHIHYRYRRPAEVEYLQLRKAASYLELRFEDNGIGFENEYSGKIFQIFQRLHGRSEYEGNGIGLAIVKKIVEHHGGSIGAHGDLDKGAVFTLTLPL